jgi:hypothetical protein
MKYSSFIKKLSKFAESDYEFGVQNDSSDNIDVTLKYKSGHSWETFKERVEKMIKILATETLIYVKDSVVVEYEDIADYLTEFRVHREYVRLQKSIHDLRVYNEELEFLKAKLEYLNFMLAKKRANAEIDIFLGVYTSRIKSRLERTLLRDLSQETLLKTQELIDEMIKTIAEENKTMQLLEASHLKLKEETPVLNKSTHNKSVDLFLEDATEIDGIEIFTGEEKETDDQEDDSEDE